MYVLNKTKIFCSISNPGTDLTGVLYNEIIGELGIDGVYLPLTAKNVPSAFSGAKSFGFSGVTVSMPYKQEIIAELDELDHVATKIGAVNTVIEAEGMFIGSNTDCYGAVMSLQEKTELQGKRVLLLGAGGAAQAIAFGLHSKGAETTIANRTYEKATKLAEKYDFSATQLDEIDTSETYEVIINATSVGFSKSTSNEIIVAEDMIARSSLVMDIVFSPIETPLLNMARQKKVNAISGTRMLVHQAVRQFQLWGYATKVDIDNVENKLSRYLEK